MNHKNIKVVVTGDICINLLQWRTHNEQLKGFSWNEYPLVHNTVKNGEAMLLSKLVKMSSGANVISPEINLSKEYMQENMLLSAIELDLFPINSKQYSKKTYRVKQFLGFSGPRSGNPRLFPLVNDDADADLVIIDDENNGFNSNEQNWPLALKTPGKTPFVIYKTMNSNSTNPLWNHLENNHIENTVVIINGDDLRSKGVNISRGLSWERTALDFVWQIGNNPNLGFLTKCHHLIVPFGLEGAIYYKNNGTVAESYLYFLTYEFEGEFIKDNQGKMYGLTSCFVAGLCKVIVSGIGKKHKFKNLDDGIREGMVAAQKYFSKGFGLNPEEKKSFPNPNIFNEEENDFIFKEHIQSVLIRNSNNPNCQACWYIIKDKSSTNLSEIAYDIVKNGDKSALRFIPIAKFGNLKAVDRTEIEAYRSIKNLMTEYISNTKTVRPLSIAVFGTPGSGKSFGVSEVASSIASSLIVKLNFNLSQFQSVSDLTAAFHRVRDRVLEGKLPLVFFDEFDSYFEGRLGWLKYFLSPMQDGVFREGDSLHPIGKAIFVFAGGTSSTFNQFCGVDIDNEVEYGQFTKEFQLTKGPDFVSRLRGYVNILGPNQTNKEWDQLFIIRRAMLLRSLLERKTPQLINESGVAQIDSGLMRALLKVARYKHEARSMEAIMEMSTLSNAKKWEQSHLPSKEQLKLHVDEEEFVRHLMLDTFYSEKIEKISEALHNHDNGNHNDQNQNEILNCIQPWYSANEEYRNSIRDRVRHIPNALLKINFDLISMKEKPTPIEFTERELISLAEYEHKRWSLEKKEKGWTFGEKIDEKKKIHPSLVTWDNLPQEEKERIIEDIKIWPKVLADSNFKVEKMKYLCYCEANGFNPIENR